MIQHKQDSIANKQAEASEDLDFMEMFLNLQYDVELLKLGGIDNDVQTV